MSKVAPDKRVRIAMWLGAWWWLLVAVAAHQTNPGPDSGWDGVGLGEAEKKAARAFAQSVLTDLEANETRPYGADSPGHNHHSASHARRRSSAHRHALAADEGGAGAPTHQHHHHRRHPGMPDAIFRGPSSPSSSPSSLKADDISLGSRFESHTSSSTVARLAELDQDQDLMGLGLDVSLAPSSNEGRTVTQRDLAPREAGTPAPNTLLGHATRPLASTDAPHRHTKQARGSESRLRDLEAVTWRDSKSVKEMELETKALGGRLGTVVIQRLRQTYNQKVLAVMPLSNGERAMWDRIIGYSTSPSHSFLKLQAGNKAEEMHVWITGQICNNPQMIRKRQWMVLYRKWKKNQPAPVDPFKRQEDAKPASANPFDMQDPFVATADEQMEDAMRAFGREAVKDKEDKAYQIESVMSHLILPIYLHGCPLMDEDEMNEAKLQVAAANGGLSPEEAMMGRPLSDEEAKLKEQMPGLAKGATQAVAGLNALGTKLYGKLDKEAAAAALKEWVAPKWQEDIKAHEGDDAEDLDTEFHQCPHLSYDGRMFTLLAERHDLKDPDRSKLMDKQLCWMCRSMVGMMQEMTTTPFGATWDTSTDNVNHALTNVCDRIAEVNSSPHWQSDCKNLVEYYGPEILCFFENGGEKVDPKWNKPTEPAPTEAEGDTSVQYDIETSFTGLSGILCQHLQMKVEDPLGAGEAGPKDMRICRKQESE